jgi:hypothetical protein
LLANWHKINQSNTQQGKSKNPFFKIFFISLAVTTWPKPNILKPHNFRINRACSPNYEREVLFLNAIKKMKKQNTIFTFNFYLFTLLRNTTYASRNTVQSKLNDYAKQTQFPKGRK